MLNIVLTPLYEKKRELETEIAKLHSIQEVALRESTEASGNVTEIRARIATLEQEVVDMEKEAISAITEAGEAVSKGIEGVKEVREVVECGVTALKALEDKIDQLIEKVKKAKEDESETRKEIARENEKIDVAWRDIGVIKGRLQKKYDELGLGPTNI